MLIISKSNGEIVQANPEIVLFDKDGTLIDVHHYWSSMLRLRGSLITEKWFKNHSKKNSIERELIEAMGIDLLSGKIKVSGPVGIKSRKFIENIASNIVSKNGVSIEDKEMEDIFLEVDRKTSRNMTPLLKLLPGVFNLLKKFENTGVAMVVVSTDITSRVSIALKCLKIDHFFSEIIGGDEVQNTKPFPDLALLVSSRTGIGMDKMMVIGDNPVDIQMGLSANINLNIAVLTGLSDKNSFKDLNCMVVDDLKSIEVENVK
jgi:phosphoglycolate phosphatase